MTESLPSAIRWKIADQAATQGLALVASMVLARLLLPETFGLFAMLALAVAVGMVFIEGGLGAALIQRQDITPADENTVFWFNLAAGTAFATVLVLAAPWIAGYFGQPVLAPLARVLAVNMIMTTLLTVPVSRLVRVLDFRRLTVLSAVSVSGAGVLAVVLALRGWGVWALAAQVLATNAIKLSLVPVLAAWRPTGGFERERFARLVEFGGWMLISNLLDIVARRAYTVLVGKYYTAADLGIFNRAVDTRNVPQVFIGTTFQRLAFPVFSRLQDDLERLRRALRDSLSATMALNLPVMAGVALVAENAVPVLFGHQWDAVVPYLQVLCAAGALVPLQVGNRCVLTGLGHARLAFRLSLASQMLLLVVVIVTSQVSLQALAWGMVASQAASLLMHAVFTRRLLGYGLWAQLKDLAPYLGLTAAMALAVLAQRAWFMPEWHLLALVTSMATGLTVYGAGLLLFRPQALGQARELLGWKSPAGAAGSPVDGRSESAGEPHG